MAVLILYHRLGQLTHLFGGNPTLTEGDALQAGYLQALALLNHFDEGRGLGEAVVRTGIEPGKSAAKGLHAQLAILKEALVHAGNLQLATGGGLDAGGYINHLVGIEIEAHYGVVALGFGGFLLDAQAVALGVELGHAVAFGVAHPVAKNGGFLLLLGLANRLAQHGAQSVAMEDVVAQHEAGAVIADKLATDDEGLCQTVGRGLLGV